MKVYALTGGIAAGKSEVSRKFMELGIPVVDADVIAHTVMEPGGRAFDAVVDHFGDSVLTDGRIDRALLGKRVFDEPEELARLNAIVHPAVQLEIARRLAEHSKTSEVAIVDAALHAENGRLADGMAGLVLVLAPEAIRIQRMMEKRNMTGEEARKRISAQTPPEKKRELATWIIENTGTIEELHHRVEAVAQEMLA